jgi:predicted alpha-1,2-mannosidase
MMTKLIHDFSLPLRSHSGAVLRTVGMLLLAASPFCASAKPLVDCINPMIGASTSREHGEGKTFPGAATPFGLVQLSPDTITGGDNGPGYSYHHTSMEGFSFTHMSGVGWHGDFGNFLVMPTTGKLKTERGHNGAEDGYRSRFSHDNEVAQAGYYAVTLDDYRIRAEMTAAPRAGILRFTFPKSNQSRLQIDLARRVGGTSTRQSIKVVDAHTIEGWMKCTPDGGGWGNGGGRADYTVFFSAQFSRPLTNFGVWYAAIPADWKRKREDIESQRYRDVVAAAKILPGCREMEGDHLGFFSEFATAEAEPVLLKAGISFVSVAGARANLRHDIANWDFDQVRQQARRAWEQALAGVAVEGGSDGQREAFATALYHSMIDPRAFSDQDGRYVGADRKIHQTGNFTYRTTFSGWDVFRSQYPLLTIIRPDVVNDTVNSLMQQAELSGNGYLARWEFVGVESGCMIGDPAVSVFADAYLRGIRSYDVEKAYELCRASVMGPKRRRGNLAAYETLGFVPGGVSWTLENAYFDYCAGRFAAALGHTNDANLLLGRSLNYKKIYDPTVGNMRARNADGSWTTWHGATGHGQGCVESNPYQQGWFVPHDVAGLIELMGQDYFLLYLTAFFEKTPTDFKRNDFYNHSNEPVHHVPYLFTYAGAPWLSQKWARFTMDHAYGSGVKGLCGNEDVGQMSAWYILSAIGFHPVSPVDGVYIIGSPLFDKVSIRLDAKYYAGREFTVLARNNSPQNIYVQSAKLNGQPLQRAWLAHAEIVGGGTLEFVMGPTPNQAWGSAIAQRPPSLSRPNSPQLEASSR